MSSADPSTSSLRVLGVIRVSVGLAVLSILAYAYALANKQTEREEQPA